MARIVTTPPDDSAEVAELTADELAGLRQILETKRRDILNEARKGDDREPDVLPDEMDQAAAETEASLSYRLRDRGKALLRKIDHVLERIRKGEYDECEDCGDTIDKRRLFARPETTLCIDCKESRERTERQYVKPRERRAGSGRFDEEERTTRPAAGGDDDDGYLILDAAWSDVPLDTGDGA